MFFKKKTNMISFGIMRFLKYSIVFGLIAGLTGPIFAEGAEEGISGNVSIHPVIKSHKFTSEIDKLNKELLEEKYSTAIETAQKLADALKEIQKQHLQSFFPSKFGKFSEQSWESPSEVTDSHGGNYGVLLNKSYRNKKEDSIEVNVVSKDTSIGENINIVKTPRILQTLDNLSLIKVLNKYDALEKKDETQEFLELNIIINDDLLINIIANGVTDPKILQEFFENSDVDGLATYLQK